MPPKRVHLAAALEGAEVDGQALQVRALSRGDRQFALAGDAFSEALASQGLDSDDLEVRTGLGPRINVLAISGATLRADDWEQQYIAVLSREPRFDDFREISLGGKSVTSLSAVVENCLEPCVDSLVVYSLADTVVIIQSVSTEKAGELLAQLP